MKRTYKAYKKIGVEKGEILKCRKQGYYWVRYSYSGSKQWRIGFYNAEFGFWHLDGDPRSFYDNDLLEISERRVPRKWVSDTTMYFLLVMLTVILIASIHDIYKLITK